MEKAYDLPLQIIKGSGPNLFGQNWLRHVKLNWSSIKRLSNDLGSVLDKDNEVFGDNLGVLKGVKAQLFVKQGAVPKLFKPRSVPHALKDAI